jgi:hypothetical protein
MCRNGTATLKGALEKVCKHIKWTELKHKKNSNDVSFERGVVFYDFTGISNFFDDLSNYELLSEKAILSHRTEVL